MKKYVYVSHNFRKQNHLRSNIIAKKIFENFVNLSFLIYVKPIKAFEDEKALQIKKEQFDRLKIFYKKIHTEILIGKISLNESFLKKLVKADIASMDAWIKILTEKFETK